MPQRSSHQPQVSRHLVEILATGFIIVAVAFLVSRVYVKTMDQANKATCVSNLSQLGRAIMAYAQDYDEKLPVGPAWQDAIMVQISDIPDWGIYYCPERKNERGYSYGLNVFLGGQNMDVPHPSETILFCDVRSNTREIWWANDIRFLKLGHNRTPNPCHRNKANFVFVDGHAKTEDWHKESIRNWDFR